MPLETGTFINDLVTSNPDGGDARQTADDHLRLIKRTLKQTFPQVAGEVSVSHGELNFLRSACANIQTQLNNLRNSANYALSAGYAQQATSLSGKATIAYYGVLLFNTVSAQAIAATTVTNSFSIQTSFGAGARQNVNEHLVLSDSGVWLFDIQTSMSQTGLSATADAKVSLVFQVSDAEPSAGSVYSEVARFSSVLIRNGTQSSDISGFWARRTTTKEHIRFYLVGTSGNATLRYGGGAQIAVLRLST